VEVVSIAGGDCASEGWTGWYDRHGFTAPGQALAEFRREPGLMLLPTDDGAPGGAHCAGWPAAAP